MLCPWPDHRSSIVDAKRFLPALQTEQKPLRRQPAAEAGERSVAADDAMAGDDDRDRVLTVGRSDRPHGVGAANLRRDRRIAPRFTVRNLRQRAPDVLLKRRAPRRQRYIESLQLSGKVQIELSS